VSSASSIPLTLNGEPTSAKAGVTVRDLLEAAGYTGAVVAVAVNGTFVPKSTHPTHRLSAGDAVEVVAPMAGG
jgi:sulfur carrier protein